MKGNLFADIILPLAVKGTFTYIVPDHLASELKTGQRVIVQFGKKKLYTGIVFRIHSHRPDLEMIKEITETVDKVPLVNEEVLRFWEWLADYYMCTPGEVMKAALPSSFYPESETIIEADPSFEDIGSLDRTSAKLLDVIISKKRIKPGNLPQKFDNRNTLKLVNNLICHKAVAVGVSLRNAPLMESEKFVVLAEKFTSEWLEEILLDLGRAPRQKELLEKYISITGYGSGKDIIPVRKTEFRGMNAALAALTDKNILRVVDLEKKDISKASVIACEPEPLTGQQSEAYEAIKAQYRSGKRIFLINGVTSSGKTQLYIHLIKEKLTEGKQVLYLLPEIALTGHVIERLKKYFGENTAVYHSRISARERSAIIQGITENDPSRRINLLLGARSSVLLPFRNPGLIIVDEEHDGSYKQDDPAPRYNARDSAIMLAHFYNAVTILGSATPSVESYHNALSGKYGYVELKERYGRVNLPEIIVVNTREAARKKLMVSHFSPQLIELIDEALTNGEQVLLFRNRRGFSSYLECSECGWIPVCTQCAVNLTYHREQKRAVCHYCGISVPVPVKCPLCGSFSIETRGFGTEKIEDEIKLLFPQARVARMDQDTTRKTDAFNRIIEELESGKTDILTGTQMISKGLDIENLTVVGILNADSLLNYPDFRAHERAFQMMSQVSGRAGRRKKQGKVVIQVSDPHHRVIQYVMRNDYKAFYRYQTEERKTFNYPPFCRLIRITVKHKRKDVLEQMSGLLAERLREYFGKRVLGPEYPHIPRIQQWYNKVIMIKIEKDRPVVKAKEHLLNAIEAVRNEKSASTLRIVVDVDPY